MIKNPIIERIRRIVATHTSTGAVLWAISQPQNCKLTFSSDTVTASDALGAPIAEFTRAKTAEFSVENAMFDLGLFAAQNGTTVETASTGSTFNVPWFDEIKTTTADEVDLTNTPVTGTLKEIYIELGDGSLGEKFTIGQTASGNTFTLANKKASFASGKMPVGTTVFAMYDFEATGATGLEADRVISSASKLPSACVLTVEALCVDPCSQSDLHAMILRFPNAKLSSDVDISLDTEMSHPLTVKCQQQYCDHEKKLVEWYMPSVAASV